MRQLPIAAATACASTLLFATNADARTSYDGAWNLAFITQSGPCDPTYDFPVDITNGVITQPNLVRFRGNVTARGIMHALVAVQEKFASGSGRLTGASGRGTWSGHAGNAQCTGYWTAQRE